MMRFTTARRLAVALTFAPAFALALVLGGTSPSVLASQTDPRMPPIDPLNSPAWDVMHRQFLSGAKVVFDDRVTVMSPDAAEDAMELPVSVRVDDSLGPVEEIFVFSDLNPIAQVLRFYPEAAKPALSFRMKVQQATPIRAAARTADGTWHVGGRWVDAVGGGCTAPSHGTASGDWADTLGDVTYARWARGDTERVRLRIMHPMDTGLASGIPEFHIETLALNGENGEPLARLELYEPVNENPIFSLDIDAVDGKDGGAQVLEVVGVDNNGNPIKAKLAP